MLLQRWTADKHRKRCWMSLPSGKCKSKLQRDSTHTEVMTYKRKRYVLSTRWRTQNPAVILVRM